ncbi:hypothetical protein Tco_1524335 [Tanacetum coccineum]
MVATAVRMEWDGEWRGAATGRGGGSEWYGGSDRSGDEKRFWFRLEKFSGGGGGGRRPESCDGGGSSPEKLREEREHGTVRFGNDQIAKIMGYDDYQLGNVIISRVYYVEGLGHNLFSVGQFCDADLEVAFC